jgi:hypothetical protein
MCLESCDMDRNAGLPQTPGLGGDSSGFGAGANNGQIPLLCDAASPSPNDQS